MYYAKKKCVFYCDLMLDMPVDIKKLPHFNNGHNFRIVVTFKNVRPYQFLFQSIPKVLSINFVILHILGKAIILCTK